MLTVDSYKVIASRDLRELEQEVTRYVKAGWKPHGRMVIDSHHDENSMYIMYYQPIVRTRRNSS